MSGQYFIFYVTPMGKPRMTQRDKWKKRDVVVRYYALKDALRWEAKRNGWKPTPTLSITFYIPMPKSWSKKKKTEMMWEHHQEKPDLDNLVKAFKDCLYEEDKMVHTYVRIQKVWDHEGSIVVTN